MGSYNQDALLQLEAPAKAGVQNYDVFADATSGSMDAIERPGMKHLLEYAVFGGTMLVWRVDRLGPTPVDVLNAVNVLRERGVNVLPIEVGIDHATSAG